MLEIFDDYRAGKLKSLLAYETSPGKRPQLHVRVRMFNFIRLRGLTLPLGIKASKILFN